MKSNVVKLIERLINLDTPSSAVVDKINEEQEKECVKNSAIRLYKSWDLYKGNDLYKHDFEIALRDFLLLTKGEMAIENYEISDFGESIGIRKGESGIWVAQNYPQYIIKNFATNVAIAESVKQKEYDDCYLKTNTYIKSLTGFDRFKSEEQKLCVMGALRAPSGSSVLVSMSTGSGKSLVTQTVAFQKEGLTIVIVPTISLMIDQQKNACDIMPKHRDEIAIYNSSTNFVDLNKKLISHKIKLLFLSPEALIKNNGLVETITNLNRTGWLKNIIIDEAHIVLEWGDSFRLDFQCVDVFRRKLFDENKKLRTFLLSATFNPNSVKLLKQFYSSGNNWIELRCDSLRHEIYYDFIKAQSFFDKEEKMLELISLLPHPMIVYVDRPDEAKRIQKKLSLHGINNTRIFTGETNSKERETLIEGWSNNDFQIMIATCAFGVGVDKKDVRTVLHLYVPDNINKYYQEAGRGGRDGCSSLSIVLYTKTDIDNSFSYIKSRVLTSEKIIKRWFSMFNGKTSIKHGDNRVTLDTSIKPNYEEQDDYVTQVNSRDVDWNVYVILFLKRYNMINIEAINYVNNNYSVLVKINDNILFIDDGNIPDKIIELREHEWGDLNKAYREMIQFLSQCNKQCVSDALINQFPLVPYEYCNGCNAHVDKKVKGAYNGLPLVSKLEYIENSEDKFEITNSLLIIRSDDFRSVVTKSINKGLKTIVLNDTRLDLNEGNTNTDIILLTMNEFKKIIDKNPFYMSKTILLEGPSDENQIINTLQLVDRIRNAYNVKFIWVTKENYYINTFNKRLYEIMESSFIEDYMFV